MSLELECEEDELSEAQKKHYDVLKKEREEFTKKFEEIVSSRNAEIVAKGQYITVYQMSSIVSFAVAASAVSQPVSAPSVPSTIGLIKPAPTSSLLASPQVPVQNVVSNPNTNILIQSGLRNTNVTSTFPEQAATYQLLMIPKVAPNQSVGNGTPSTSSFVVSAPNTGFITNPVPKTNVTPVRPPPVLPASSALAKISSNKEVTIHPTSSVSTTVKPKPGSSGTNTGVSSGRSKVGATTRKEPPAAVVDLTVDESKTPEPDSREVSFARFPGKTFPSLMVVARPYLKTKGVSSAEISKERNILDGKVKDILARTPTEFTEWLIQKGLVAAELVCNVHVNSDMTPVKMKLGMYSDSSRFPYSGGFVRISECCTQKFVSVFQGSLFENSPHPPTVLLKLIYHWCCHTTINNIIAWVRGVDNLYVKNFFTDLRAICTAVVHERFGKIGGPNKTVEVGIISLGTTSPDGQIKQVKVEVLGVLDYETKNIRLRAVDPPLSQDPDKGLKARFVQILKHLDSWVHKDTTILTDATIDKNALAQLGYKNIIQSIPSTSQNADNNNVIMDYLKRIVPRMFQNTLSLLNTRLIQQFLDELSWRECWGALPSKAFDNIIAHIAEQSNIVSGSGDTLCNVLSEISKDPFRDWSYAMWKSNYAFVTSMQKQLYNILEQGSTSSVSHHTKTPVLPAKKDEVLPVVQNTDKTENMPNNIAQACKYTEDKIKPIVDSSINPFSHDLISLEGYYYGSLPPDNVVVVKLKKINLNVKCSFCGSLYNNNIAFMKHLVGHALNHGAFTTEHQCRYCLTSFTSMERLEEHMYEEHNSSPISIRCLICEEQFTQRVTLITHMHLSHKYLEMPYQCVICKYRTSEHKKIIDHFYDIHNGGERVQCPFCLKVLALESNNKKMTSNISFFVSHIERHQKKYAKWDCNRCMLTFVNRGYLREHQSKDHNSCRMPGTLRYPKTLTSILMPPPPSSVYQQRRPKLCSTVAVGFYSMNKLQHTHRPLKPNSICFECSGYIQDTSHFGYYLLCMRCTYATCCKIAITMHVETIHDKKIAYTTKVHESKNFMYCMCGYTGSNPDDCARHLVSCNRKTIYGSAEKASNYLMQTQSASFPTLVTLDDASSDEDSKSSKNSGVIGTKTSNDDNASAPNMLSILGLRRKSPDSSRADEKSSKETDDLSAKDVIKNSEDKNDDSNEVIIEKETDPLADDAEEVSSEIPKDKITAEDETINQTDEQKENTDVVKSPSMTVDEETNEPSAGLMETDEQNQNLINEKMDVQDEPHEMDVDDTGESGMIVDVDLQLNTMSP